MSPEEYHELWSSVGFWVLVAGLIGDILVVFIPSQRKVLEKTLAVFFTILVVLGVWMEHRHDSAIKQLAKADADAARSEQKKLAESIIPRDLLPHQRAKVLPQIEPFAGQQVRIVVDPHTLDAAHISPLLVSVLKSAGWIVGGEPIHDTLVWCHGRTGIFVWASDNASEKVMTAAHALADAFNELNLETSVSQEAQCIMGVRSIPPRQNSDELIINVFPK